MFELYKHLNIEVQMHEFLRVKRDGTYRNHSTFKWQAWRS
jgi:hypothetical protein